MPRKPESKKPMKKIALTLAAGMMLAGAATRVFAADTNQVTITGTMVCGKCTLHETKSCQNVVQVMQGTNTVNYYLNNNDVSKAAHDPICRGGSQKKSPSPAPSKKRAARK